MIISTEPFSRRGLHAQRTILADVSAINPERLVFICRTLHEPQVAWEFPYECSTPHPYVLS